MVAKLGEKCKDVSLWLWFFKGTSGRFLIHLQFLMSWHFVERVSRCSMMQRYFSFLGQPLRNRRPLRPWKRTRSILLTTSAEQNASCLAAWLTTAADSEHVLAYCCLLLKEVVAEFQHFRLLAS